jgi:hypothetical protein
MIATSTNTIVASIDRGEKREIPQMPCPLVQPLLMPVPTPTSSPPMIKVGKEAVIEKGISLLEKIEYIKGPRINPIKNKRLSNLLLFELTKFFIIPLIPAKRPLPR